MMTTLKDYPYWGTEAVMDVKKSIRDIATIRKDDITKFKTLPDTFIGGRKVGKIPSSSADVAATDRLGDVNYDASYLYILIDNAGTPVWRRFTGGAW